MSFRRVGDGCLIKGLLQTSPFFVMPAHAVLRANIGVRYQAREGDGEIRVGNVFIRMCGVIKSGPDKAKK